jgi:hypothetical protein
VSVAGGTQIRAVMIGLGVALAMVAVQAAIAAHHQLFDPDRSARETATFCLTHDKRLVVDTAVRDPIASSASGGGVSTVIEGNPVTLSFTGSEREAAQIARLYTRIASDLGPRLLVRAHFVYVFDGEPTPTQLQTVYDCTA